MTHGYTKGMGRNVKNEPGCHAVGGSPPLFPQGGTGGRDQPPPLPGGPPWPSPGPPPLSFLLRCCHGSAWAWCFPRGSPGRARGLSGRRSLYGPQSRVLTGGPPKAPIMMLMGAFIKRTKRDPAPSCRTEIASGRTFVMGPAGPYKTRTVARGVRIRRKHRSLGSGHARPGAGHRDALSCGPGGPPERFRPPQVVSENTTPKRSCD